mmetsp:Transcript_23190/g.65927  ORF Transcript_23190/g.65927 Transcript_23190/m.65927 type:complete len:241 (-) Transcript_23190:666-1388(-)
MGPKPKAKLKTKKKALPAMTQPADLLETVQPGSESGTAGSAGFATTYSDPIKPMRPHANVMPMALHNISCRRPARSARKTAGKLARKLTKLLMVVNMFLSKPMDSKILGPKYMKAFMPTSCWRIWRVMPRTISRPQRPWKSSIQAGSPSALDFSISWKISSSSFTASASERIVSSTFRASLRLPFCTNQRGERGKQTMPTRRQAAGMQMMPITMRQPSSRSTINWSMKAANRMPKVIPSW